MTLSVRPWDLKVIKYLFDVDGTLTPSRQKIDKDFRNWLKAFLKTNLAYLVTGSDKSKTYEQIGDLYHLFQRAYQCSGNDVWEQGKNIHTNEIHLPQSLLSDLDEVLESSKFNRKTGHHIDYRPGSINFSIVGRNANLEDRFLYRQWDEHKDERKSIAIKLSRKYPAYNFQVAGETGIDITEIGHGKEQILTDFPQLDEVIFFGDMTSPGGNDYDISKKITENGGTVYTVRSWEETWSILKSL